MSPPTLLLFLQAALAASTADLLAAAAALRELRLASVPPPPSSAHAAALRGEVVTGVEGGEGVRRVWGVTVLEVPIGAFWAAINDEAGKVRWTPVDHQAMLRGVPCGPQRTVFQFVEGGAISDRWWVLEQRVNLTVAARSGGQVRELVWRSVQDAAPLLDAGVRAWADGGLQIPHTEGSWLLIDLGDGRTLVEYSSRTDPGGWIPAGIGAGFAAAGLEQNFRNLEGLARSGPGCPLD